MQHHPGWIRRRNWLLLLQQEIGKPIMRGEIEDDRKRHQQEGWCQAIDFIVARDAQIEEAWAALQAEHNQEPEQLEGGDYGVSYEAAQ